ncbi:hypothetical protein K456DRAFT_545228 [Colletotrichum gloeosporioides 23]|nr:hypothetical protein K456DRAFT_545228 [Colletotrichum gloeosporioides 23]
MAEALGTAASVIAVIDLAGKAVTLTFKLKCLWDEVKDVPAALLEKAEELQLLDEILRDDEIHAANNPLPTPAWNDAIMQKAMGRARAAMQDLQMTIDAHNRSLEDKRRHRRKFAAARVVLHKESLVAMERKLDTALRLYKMAESRYIFKTCASINARRLLPPLQASEAIETQSDNVSTSGYDTSESLRLSKSHLTKHSKPDFTAISKGTTLLGRFLFGLGYQTCHISIRTPNWLGNTVYSVMAQQSVSGWQLNLSSYAVVDLTPYGVLNAAGNNDVIALQRCLQEANLTPYVHNQHGLNLLMYAVERGAVETSRWLLRAGLYPGSFGEWSGTPSSRISVTVDARTPLERLLYHPWPSGKLERNVQILRILMDYTPDIAEEDDDIWTLIVLERTFEQYREIQRIMSPELPSAPLSSRLSYCYDMLRQRYWTFGQVLCLLPEVGSVSTELITSFWIMSGESLAISHLVGLGVGWELLESNGELPHLSKEGSYHHVLGEIAKFEPGDLSEESDTIREETPLVKMLWIIMTEFHSHSPQEFDCILQSAIRSWVNILCTNGINLMEYGHRERFSGFYDREGRIPWKYQGAGHRYTYFRVVGITYGALPEQWKVWWSVYGLEYAGEFWHMVEDPVLRIPGGWKDDFESSEEVEEVDLVPWDDEERGDWIVWSEYRKIRPPS